MCWRISQRTAWTLLFLLTWTGICRTAQKPTTSEPRNIAESNWGSTLVNWAGKAAALWGYVDSLAQEDCPEVYACPNDVKPVANELPQNAVSPNGCGPIDHNVDQYVADGMTTCCDQHDICFSTCGSRKSDCDIVFKKCLYDACRADTEGKQNKKVCQISAKVLYGLTTLAGCSLFEASQTAACLCEDPRPPRRAHRKEL
ncbi:hypothetical protein BV898_18059 [Hypsibius exemplaris]|uniref:Group XIIA secretory phospholipase A2 n=1 Tax=Hypsibius exemplaris TaxID=2072580 RepID=A0A9X6NIQ1_HYPEX|nr:hypothetical protein BV898_18059 [Hypsibius exemplaris]